MPGNKTSGRGNAPEDGYTVYSRRPLGSAPGNALPVSEADERNAFYREMGPHRSYGPPQDVEIDPHVVIPRHARKGERR